MKTPKEKYESNIVWPSVIVFAYLHVAALYGTYLLFTSAKLMTAAFAFVLYMICGAGITAGAHRLWAHKSYKAKWPLQVLLMISNSVAFQYPVIHWARDHRVHHKFSETNADPYNVKRGFFFAHVGWLLCRKHPDVKEKGKEVDVSDLEKNPVLAFQKRFIYPSENLGVSIVACGEGWHNYHHVFPWDYKTSELGNYRFNITTAFIDLFAKIGWAYDLKMVPSVLVQKKVKRSGDGSHEVWGWDDADQTQEDRDMTVVMHSLKKDQ
ncbi:acyl-CoA Delta-9 desaturase-like isoform X2 [Andrena cerasifolii]|uniref:acyl-CoA Delta-9 desaturase-like isoform X2 n=1 Tax=Andrena cerasifolii TaxID=2819439 RepID=UPI004037F1D8